FARSPAQAALLLRRFPQVEVRLSGSQAVRSPAPIARSSPPLLRSLALLYDLPWLQLYQFSPEPSLLLSVGVCKPRRLHGGRDRPPSLLCAPASGLPGSTIPPPAQKASLGPVPGSIALEPAFAGPVPGSTSPAVESAFAVQPAPGSRSYFAG